MAIDPDDPRLDLDLGAILDSLPWLVGADRDAVIETVTLGAPSGVDGNVQLSVLLLSALGHLREDAESSVGFGLLAVAETLARHSLLLVD
jgi:hypothetical protein